jgi:hypothetical protein
MWLALGGLAMNMLRPRSSSWLPAIAALGVSLSAAAFVPSVYAQGGRASREQERTSLYAEGLALAETQRWEDALLKFEQVVAIRSAPRALFALATAQEKTGRLTIAKRTYLKAQADAGQTAEKEMVERVTSALATLESRMPRVLLRLPSGVTGAAVSLDGVPVDVKPEGIEIDPGEHRIVVAVAGHLPYEKTFPIAEGQRKELFVETNPDARPSAMIPAPLVKMPDSTRDSGPNPPLPVWILGGAGVVATTIGLIVRANGASDYDDAKAQCSEYPRCTSNDVVTNGNSGRDRMRVGGIVAAVGGVTVVGAGVFWALAASGSRRTSEPHALSVRAQASADGCELRLNGAF